jgi:RNA polymerase subunit RPABC4/transcription elongation factor Spt4
MEILEYANKIIAFFTNPFWKYLLYGIIFMLIIVWISLVYWTFRDAKLRNAPAIFWGFIVLIFNYVGIILYLILRPPEYIDDVVERELEIRKTELLLNGVNLKCPACGKEIKEDFLICPYCRKKLKNSCINCGRPLDLNWKVCPYCKTPQ